MMVSTSRVETLLTCAKALLTCAKGQERHAMLPDGFSVGWARDYIAETPRASFIFPAYARLSLPHIESSLVLSSVIACLPYLTMVLVLFWNYSEYICSLQMAKQL